MNRERRSDGERTRVQITDEGRLLAEVDLTADAADSVLASLRAESGTLPAGTRTRLVDALLEEPQVQAATHLTAAVPRGDAESLVRLQERCATVQTRPAGASVIVEAELPHD